MVEFGGDVILLFVPLIIGVVVQLSNIVRNADDPGDDPFVLPGKIVPRLGQLNFTHGTNLVLLAGCFLLALEHPKSAYRNLLALFVLLIWLQLPTFEVRNYGKVQSKNGPLTSFHFHVVSTFVVTGYIWTFGGVDVLVDSLDLNLFEEGDQIRNAIVLLLFAQWFGFLTLVSEEIASKEERHRSETDSTAADSDGLLSDYGNANHHCASEEPTDDCQKPP